MFIPHKTLVPGEKLNATFQWNICPLGLLCLLCYLNSGNSMKNSFPKSRTHHCITVVNTEKNSRTNSWCFSFHQLRQVLAKSRSQLKESWTNLMDHRKTKSLGKWQSSVATHCYVTLLLKTKGRLHILAQQQRLKYY